MDSGNNKVIKKASFVLILGLTISTLISLYTLHLSINQKKSEEKLATFEQLSHLKQQVEGNLSVLDSINNFYLASGYVNREEFSVFTKSFFATHTGLLALEWVPIVNDREKQDFIQLAMKDGIVNKNPL